MNWQKGVQNLTLGADFSTDKLLWSIESYLVVLPNECKHLLLEMNHPWRWGPAWPSYGPCVVHTGTGITAVLKCLATYVIFILMILLWGREMLLIQFYSTGAEAWNFQMCWSSEVLKLVGAEIPKPGVESQLTHMSMGARWFAQGHSGKLEQRAVNLDRCPRQQTFLLLMELSFQLSFVILKALASKI